MAEIDTPQWYTLIDKHLYMVMLNRNLSLDQVHRLDQEILVYLNTSPASLVHFFYDTRLTVSHPSFNDLRKLKFPSHPKIGYGILVGKNRNPATDLLFTMISGIFRTRVARVLTLSEACDFLIKKDPSLPMLETWHLPTDFYSVHQ